MVVTREKKLGNLNGFTGGNFAGNVYDKDMRCPTISACSGGNTQPMMVDEKEKPIVVDMYNDRQIDGDVCGTLTTGCARGGNGSGTFGVVSVGTVNPSNKGINGNVVSSEGLARAVTTEKGEGQKVCVTQSADDYRIRKLTPRECWRLMGYTDEDFDKAAAVNSNTQLYKEAGNAIVKQVLMAIFSQMNIKGVTPWNERTDAEIREITGGRNE